jgi:hypothetical protein
MKERKHFLNSLRALLEADEPADPLKAARWRWVRCTARAWADAQRRCEAAWDELMKDIPEEEIDEVELPEPPEEAEVNALWAQLDDVIQADRWPRELYWGGI